MPCAERSLEGYAEHGGGERSLANRLTATPVRGIERVPDPGQQMKRIAEWCHSHHRRDEPELGTCRLSYSSEDKSSHLEKLGFGPCSQASHHRHRRGSR